MPPSILPLAAKQTCLPAGSFGEDGRRYAVGVYVLEEDRQAEEHDRRIPDDVRVAVLKRDNFSCTWENCGWTRSMLSPDDPRKFLELHHITHHKDKGANTVENLRTICNVHHDQLHREMRKA